jgi:hypothetical protein
MNFFNFFSKQTETITETPLELEGDIIFTETVSNSLGQYISDLLFTMDDVRRENNQNGIYREFLISSDINEIKLTNMFDFEIEKIEKLKKEYFLRIQKFQNNWVVINENRDRFYIHSYDDIKETYKLVMHSSNYGSYDYVRILSKKYVEENFEFFSKK